MILFPAKTEILFQEAIILVILIKIDLHLLKVELIFLPEIFLSPCVDSIIKGIKKLVPRALFSYISPWHFFKNTRTSLSATLVILKIPTYIIQQCTRRVFCAFSTSHSGLLGHGLNQNNL